MEAFTFVKKSNEENISLIKEFINRSDKPFQIDIINNFKHIIPINKVRKITLNQEYVGVHWNVERAIPKGYRYIPIQ